MVLRILPLLAGILPLVAMFGAFWLGVANEALPSCIPFVDGCVSISATGRKPPGSFLFRAIMLPQAALLAAVWYFSVLWLRALSSGAAPPNSTRTAATVVISGLVGAMALVVYVTFLGTTEPIYEFMRRTGIYFGFLGTALAQLFLALALNRIARNTGYELLAKKARLLLLLAVLPFALGVLNTALKSFVADVDASENRIEWLVSLVMQSYFVVLYFAWRATGIEAAVTVRDQ